MKYEFLPFRFRENAGWSGLSAVPDENMLCNLRQAFKGKVKNPLHVLDEINTSQKISEISKTLRSKFCVLHDDNE